MTLRLPLGRVSPISLVAHTRASSQERVAPGCPSPISLVAHTRALKQERVTPGCPQFVRPVLVPYCIVGT